MKIEMSVVIDRPVDDVWNFMTDWSNFAKMNPVILEARQTSTGPIGIGTTIEARLRNPNIIQRDTNIRVIEYEPKRRFAFEHTTGTLKGARTTFSVESIDGKSRLTLATDAKLSGFFRLVGPLVAGRAKREVGEEISNVKRIMESEAQSQSMPSSHQVQH